MTGGEGSLPHPSLCFCAFRPRLAGAWLQAGLLDELIIYMAPTLMGDLARPLLQLPLDSMSDKVALTVSDVRRVGQDWRFTVLPS